MPTEPIVHTISLINSDIHLLRPKNINSKISQLHLKTSTLGSSQILYDGPFLSASFFFLEVPNSSSSSGQASLSRMQIHFCRLTLYSVNFCWKIKSFPSGLLAVHGHFSQTNTGMIHGLIVCQETKEASYFLAGNVSALSGCGKIVTPDTP